MYEAQESALFLFNVYLLMANLILSGYNFSRGNLIMGLFNLGVAFFPLFNLGVMVGIIAPL